MSNNDSGSELILYTQPLVHDTVRLQGEPDRVKLSVTGCGGESAYTELNAREVEDVCAFLSRWLEGRQR